MLRRSKSQQDIIIATRVWFSESKKNHLVKNKNAKASVKATSLSATKLTTKKKWGII